MTPNSLSLVIEWRSISTRMNIELKFRPWPIKYVEDGKAALTYDMQENGQISRAYRKTLHSTGQEHFLNFVDGRQ